MSITFADLKKQINERIVKLTQCQNANQRMKDRSEYKDNPGVASFVNGTVQKANMQHQYMLNFYLAQLNLLDASEAQLYAEEITILKTTLETNLVILTSAGLTCHPQDAKSATYYLQDAIDIEDQALFEAALFNGADVNDRSGYKYPLINAAKKNNLRFVLRLLEYPNINVNHNYDLGGYRITAINAALDNLNIDMVRALIDKRVIPYR